MSRRAAAPVSSRLGRLAWSRMEASLWNRGYARSERLLLTARECAALISLYRDDALFRSGVDMERHRFGEGEYKYFARPLPAIVEELRASLYARLAPIANAWREALAQEEAPYPPDLRSFLAECRRRGQTKPTPLLLRYGEGGYNCLHQDLYGEVAFPLQAMIPLSRPVRDYEGGEFLLVEQRPRAQSAGEAILPGRGELVVFPNRFRPAAGAKGFHRVSVRHGASRIRAGERFALALIFHDAK